MVLVKRSHLVLARRRRRRRRRRREKGRKERDFTSSRYSIVSLSFIFFRYSFRDSFRFASTCSVIMRGDAALPSSLVPIT